MKTGRKRKKIVVEETGKYTIWRKKVERILFQGKKQRNIFLF